MPENVVSCFFSNSGDRNTVRMRVVNKLSEEAAGKGSGELASRYTYYVENTNFNSGGRWRNYPSHPDIINDLIAKNKQNNTEYAKLYTFMEKVYNCEDVNFADANALSFSSGFACDLILSVLKWMLIEQDIRYWNYSGRDMLWSGIKEIK